MRRKGIIDIINRWKSVQNLGFVIDRKRINRLVTCGKSGVRTSRFGLYTYASRERHGFHHGARTNDYEVVDESLDVIAVLKEVRMPTTAANPICGGHFLCLAYQDSCVS